jgi:hypothetical protein
MSRSKQADLLHLARLPEERPATKAGQIRWLWPQIRTALASGHNLREISARLNADGIDVPYSRLRYYVAILKRAEAPCPCRQEEPSVSGAPRLEDHRVIAPAETLPPVSRSAPDPLSNVREQRERKRRAGFDYDPFSTNKELF